MNVASALPLAIRATCIIGLMLGLLACDAAAQITDLTGLTKAGECRNPADGTPLKEIRDAKGDTYPIKWVDRLASNCGFDWEAELDGSFLNWHVYHPETGERIMVLKGNHKSQFHILHPWEPYEWY